jgi:hypothetical protein
LLLALALVTACSGGDDGSDDGSELGSTSSIAPPSPPEVPAPSPAGTGVVVIGANGTPSSFAVTACALEAEDGDTGQLLRITGEGTSSSDVPFQVEVVRSATSGAAETFTDLITYTDTARILQVQRFEAAGEVSDLRDPDARGTLLRTRADGLSAVGIAGPPGTGEKGPGLVGFALDATC